jgi:hypothetical protein
MTIACANARLKRRLRRKLGLPATERVHAATHEALDALGISILTAPARSRAGLRVKAQAVQAWGKPECWSAQAAHADACERLAAQVLDAVMGAAAP